MNLKLGFNSKKMLIQISSNETEQRRTTEVNSERYSDIQKMDRNSQTKVFCRKGVHKNVATLSKKTPAQVFSCEFCEIFKNTFFIPHFRWLFLNGILLTISAKFFILEVSGKALNVQIFH